MMRKWLILMIAAMLIGCAAVAAEAELSIVCTDFPCYDFARAVAGGRADLSMLIKPGAEVHAYDPAPSDIMAISEADLFIYIGGESDAWAESILDGLGEKAPRTLRMLDCVTDLIEEEHDEAQAHAVDEDPEYDEHIWTSPVNAARMVDAVGEVMAQIDPDRGDAYLKAAADYSAQIGAIDAEIRRIVDSAKRREMVFADRFPFIYFTRAYGIDHIAAFPSCTTDTEPSAQILAKLIRRVADDHLPVVYTIEMSTQAIARTVAEETGCRILTMQSLQTVSQSDFEAGETYVSIMRQNAEALKEGLN